MTVPARRPLVMLVGSLLIIAGGVCLGAGLKFVLTGDAIPTMQLVLMAFAAIVALIGGIALLRRAMSQATAAAPSGPGPAVGS